MTVNIVSDHNNQLLPQLFFLCLLSVFLFLNLIVLENFATYNFFFAKLKFLNFS
jgi:hypothetical protein